MFNVILQQLTVVLVLLSLTISSKTSLKFFTNVVRQPGLKSELGSRSSISTESELAWELRSSSYNARNSSCASQISFFSWKEKDENHENHESKSWTRWYYPDVSIKFSELTVKEMYGYQQGDLILWSSFIVLPERLPSPLFQAGRRSHYLSSPFQPRFRLHRIPGHCPLIRHRWYCCTASGVC